MNPIGVHGPCSLIGLVGMHCLRYYFHFGVHASPMEELCAGRPQGCDPMLQDFEQREPAAL